MRKKVFLLFLKSVRQVFHSILLWDIFVNEKDVCLVLDISNRWILVGIYSSQFSYENSIVTPRSAFQWLPETIQKLCASVSIERPDWIVSTIGPGSFTGVRLGVSFSRNLAQLWEIPVLGVASLYFYCYDLLCQNQELAGVILMIDGKQKKIYGASLDRFLLSSDFMAKNPSFASFPIVDQVPHIFFQEQKETNCHYGIYADQPEEIAQYVPREENSCAKEIQMLPKMPQPHSKNLYHLALKHGGKLVASSWKKLLPLYLRSDPANAKYPGGISMTRNRRVTFLR